MKNSDEKVNVWHSAMHKSSIQGEGIKVVRSPYFKPSPQSAFYTLSVFYTQSVFSSPRFIPSPYFIPSPQSVVRSPQSMFYTDRFYNSEDKLALGRSSQ